MTTRDLNTYRLTFKDGTTESINATGLVQAIENASKDDAVVPIVQTFMTAQGVATVVEELPTEVLFTAVVADPAGGSIATPANGSIHVGDSISLRAIPATGWQFVRWERNGEVIGTEEILTYEMSPLSEGEDTCVFVAVFAESERKCSLSVSPADATGDGCMAFPPKLSVLPGQEVSAVAVTGEGWKFDRWERDGETVGTHIVLAADATDALEQEYVAVFLRQGETGNSSPEEEPSGSPEEGADEKPEEDTGDEASEASY